MDMAGMVAREVTAASVVAAVMLLKAVMGEMVATAEMASARGPKIPLGG